MGYTHYWYTAAELDATTWAAWCDDVQQIVAECERRYGPTFLRFEQGHADAPQVSPELVRFNGGDEAHETFYIALKGRGGGGRHETLPVFGFCKTARKRYDVAVVACLVCFADRFGDQVEVSSDGYAEEWREGLAFARDATKRESLRIPPRVEVKGDPAEAEA